MNIKLYITDQGEETLKHFTYKGGSVGISYQYLWSPLAEYLVRFIPIWWAPNAITFMGFLLVILGEIIIYSTGKLGDPLSNTQLLVFSILIFTYQTLDNIDGKQARRTKTSSALGMLMDHGCDAMSCFFLCNCVIRIVGVTDQKLAIYGTYCILFIFYLSVWAQYYSNGIMSLGKINAVDDGIPAVYCLSLLTIYTGPEFWNKQAFMGIARNTMFIYAMFVAAGFQLLSLTLYAGKVLRKNLKRAIPDLAHVVIIAIALAFITQLTDWIRVDRYYNVILFCIGFMVVRNTMYMQLCVVTEQKYNQFITANVVFAIGFPAYILLRRFGIETVREEYFLYSMLAFFCLNYFHFTLSIWTQMADMLGIKVFSIRTKPTRRKWQSKKTKFSEIHNPESSNSEREREQPAKAN